jgi:hypothetical protein
MPITMASNPFATRFTRPGAIEFLFQSDESLESLIGKLRDRGWWGQILGPHGSGKSTLLAALEPKLAEAGREVVRRSLAGGQQQLELPPRLASTTILIIDGFEQLSWWSRWKVKAACRRHEAGLLVTAHADLGLPTIFQTQPSLDLARRLVSRLLPDGDRTISESDIAAAFSHHPDNFREMLFSLYDLYQARGAGRVGRVSDPSV